LAGPLVRACCAPQRPSAEAARLPPPPDLW
jgi:hypothetical protein